jgi:hypothetical protein
MWQALDLLTPYLNETAIGNPDDYVSVSGLIECVLLAAIRPETLRAISEISPEFQRAIAEWVALQIEREPAAAAIFDSAMWNFAKRTN